MLRFETILANSRYYPEQNLLYIEMKRDAEAILERVVQNFRETHAHLGEKKVKVLLDTRLMEFINVPKETLHYMGDNPYMIYQHCNALLINGLAQKLLANFYLRIVKPKVPTKMFNTLDKALEWLEVQLPAEG